MNNIFIYAVLGLFVIALLLFLVSKNNKDRKAFEQQQNQDYHKAKDEEGDASGDIDRADKV